MTRNDIITWVTRPTSPGHEVAHTIYARAPMIVRPGVLARLAEQLWDASTGTASVFQGCVECAALRLANTPFASVPPVAAFTAHA